MVPHTLRTCYEHTRDTSSTKSVISIWSYLQYRVLFAIGEKVGLFRAVPPFSRSVNEEDHR